jgi:superfamily II RNA helicase
MDMDKKLVIFDSNELGGMNEQIFVQWRGNLSRVSDGISRNTIIHDCVTYLYNEDLCPAIFFTFSKVRCEALAKQTSLQLLQPTELAEVVRIIDYYIGTSPNRESYKILPQWIDLRRCLEKGVGFHHSGLIPLFKEIVEMLYEKNLVKVLFATETFAVGVNMPTRTVVFTSLEKFVKDGQCRYLYPFEYLQMAGRAGRRGIDTLGTAILLPYGRGSESLDIPECSVLRNMIHGKSQYIRSKFTPDYTFVLKMILNGVPLLKWIEHSLYYREYAHEIASAESRLRQLEAQTESICQENSISEEEYKLCTEYNTIHSRPANLRSNTAKKRYEEIRHIKGFQQILTKYNAVSGHKIERARTEAEVENAKNAIRSTVETVLSMLKDNGYITRSDVELSASDVTDKGRVASELMECNPILMTELLSNIVDKTDSLTVKEWAGLLGLFCDSQPIDRSLLDMEDEFVPETLYHTIGLIQKTADKWESAESDRRLCLGNSWNINPYMVGAIMRWADKATTVKDIIDYYNIFEGNFIKDVLKVYNCTAEVERVAHILGKPHIAVYMTNLRTVLQRGIIGVESLYVKI